MRSPADNPAVQVSNLSFTYQEGKTPALSALNFQLAPGSFTLLLGGSGSGKTTLLWSLARVVPTFFPGKIAGSINILGKDTAGLSPQELSPFFGLILQDFASQLFSSEVTVEVAFLPENLGLPHEELSRRVRESLTMVGLADFVGRDPATLSGGERQRLAVASVLSGRAPILGFDEVKSDLDPAGRRQIAELALKLSRKGQTIISAEEEVDEGTRADSVLLLSGGKIVASGRPEKILSQPKELLNCGIRPLEVSFLADEGDSPPLTIDEALTYLRERKIEPNPKALPAPTPSYGDEIVRLDGVSYTYPQSDCGISDIDLSVKRGEFIALLGANGSGKTTLAKQLNGLLRPQQGKVFIAGKDVADYSVAELAGEVGYLFQDPDQQIFHERVADEVAFGLRNLRLPPEEIDRRTRQVLELLELSGKEEEDPYSLRKGERQRLALASVLAMRPGILILDEPTTGLDYGETCRLMKAVQEMNRRGVTIIAITHAMWLATRYATRALVMQDGRKVFDGSVEHLFSDEEFLAGQMLARPQIVELSLKLGRYCASVQRFRDAFTWRGRR
jgi:energy-coupling factor transporter ATP-binding protein EcfA2